MYKGYKYEIIPSEEQRILIHKTFGCCRLVYNHMLERKIRFYKKHKKQLSRKQISRKLTKLKEKEEYNFLYEVDAHALQCSLDNLHQAYQRFFEGQSDFPKFHSKYGGKQSYTTNFMMTTNGGNIKVLFEQNLVQIPKLGKVKAKLYKKFKGSIKYITVSFEGNRYWVSFRVEVKEPKAFPKTTQCCGIDLGVKDFATIYSLEKVDGKHCNKIENPKHLKKSQDRIKKYQRDLSRKQQGSNNYEKARKKLNKKHFKIRNQRKDFLHKLSKFIVDENQVICIEDLQVKKMIQEAPSKARDSISDVGFRMFRTMLEYKCNWYGRQLVVVPTNFPSSQLCWKCGEKNPKVKDFNVRSWVCPHCGCKHDRDKNAARNILTEGLKILKQSA